jgi:hypothetical protein
MTAGRMLLCKGEIHSWDGQEPSRSRAVRAEVVVRWHPALRGAVEYAPRTGLHAGTLMSWSSRIRSEA